MPNLTEAESALKFTIAEALPSKMPEKALQATLERLGLAKWLVPLKASALPPEGVSDHGKTRVHYPLRSVETDDARSL